MSITSTARQMTDAVGLTQRSRLLRFRTTYCRPVQNRNQAGFLEQTSRVIKAGQIVEVPTDDEEMNDLVARFYAYPVTKTRDQNGREIFEGIEPTEAPKAGRPISQPLAEDSAEGQQIELLKKISKAVEKIEVKK